MDQAIMRQRRTHSAKLKAEVVAACAEPGASVAAVALERGLNTNLVHKWRRQVAPGSGNVLLRREDEAVLTPAGPGFITLPLPAAAPEIRVEIRRGITIAVHWPVSAAGECAAWLGAGLR